MIEDTGYRGISPYSSLHTYRRKPRLLVMVTPMGYPDEVDAYRYANRTALLPSRSISNSVELAHLRTPISYQQEA